MQKQADADAYTKLKNAEAAKQAMENEAAGKKALAEATQAQGEAEAAAIKAKLEAEAEGLNKKAEAMAKYGDAAKQDMQLQALKLYFEQLPKIAEAAGNAYSNVDKIYMYGGDSSQLQGDIMKNVTQISEALGQSLGINPKDLLNSFVGAKLANASSSNKTDK